MEEVIDTYISFRYNYTTGLGGSDEDRYIQNIFEDITGYNEVDGEFLIGRAHRTILFLEHAERDEYPIDYIFDSSLEMCSYMDIYDFEEEELREDIREAMYGDDIMLNQNICIFNRLEILPKYRGLGLGKRIIKEKIEHIAYSCGLIVIKPFPLQLENEHLHSTDFEKSMGFDLMEKDEHKAFSSLRSYYESIGYQSVKNCPNFMFMVPYRARTFLKDINLEGYSEALDTLRK